MSLSGNLLNETTIFGHHTKKIKENPEVTFVLKSVKKQMKRIIILMLNKTKKKQVVEHGNNDNVCAYWRNIDIQFDIRHTHTQK